MKLFHIAVPKGLNARHSLVTTKRRIGKQLPGWLMNFFSSKFYYFLLFYYLVVTQLVGMVLTLRLGAFIHYQRIVPYSAVVY